MKIADWKSLKRHRLSAKYGDLDDFAFEGMKEFMREHGVIGGRKVVLVEEDEEWQILDGYQMQRACIDENIKPDYAPLPKGVSAEQFVHVANNLRRHEPYDVWLARMREEAESRRERAAEMHDTGMSNRAIAAVEGVSEKTIREDIKASGADRSAPETVTGRDGKEYPATKPAPAPPHDREPGDDTEASGKPATSTVDQDLDNGTGSHFRTPSGDYNRAARRHCVKCGCKFPLTDNSKCPGCLALFCVHCRDNHECENYVSQREPGDDTEAEAKLVTTAINAIRRVGKAPFDGKLTEAVLMLAAGQLHQFATSYSLYGTEPVKQLHKLLSDYRERFHALHDATMRKRKSS